MEAVQQIKPLDLLATIGFKGPTIDGLILHPDNEHLIYPIGNQIVVRHIITRSQSFLRGHDNEISVISISASGKFIASGQKTYMGFQADVIIWDFLNLKLLHRFKLHKVLVQSLSFSFNDKYLASMGGQDDNRLVIWEVASGKALCGDSTGDTANQMKFYNHSDDKIITVHNLNIKFWSVDYANKKLGFIKVNMGNIKRNFISLTIDPTDCFAYCGTKTGDFVEVSLDKALFKRLGPVNKMFPQGINNISLLLNGDIMIGAGDGSIAKINMSNFSIKAINQVLGGVTSLSLTADSTHMFVGTSQSNIYWCDTDKLVPELRSTCHNSKINHIAFPYNYSDVFATCSFQEIRIWNAKSRQELLRIQVPNLDCFSVQFMEDGKSVLSGWSDGKIRAFFPQSGKLMYVINDAHTHGVTALITSHDSQRIVSGGMEGEIRVWKVGKQTQAMEASLKEHRGRVNDIQITNDNDKAVSASSDGSCIIWDLKSFTRVICLFEPTMFKQVLFFPDQTQLLTTGSDKKISYWDNFDGQTIRSIDGAEEGEINCLAIQNEGIFFASGGEDKLIRMWKYDEGLCYYVGEGHSGSVSRVAFSPDQTTLVSVGAEGSILVWAIPKEVSEAKQESDLPTLKEDKKK